LNENENEIWEKAINILRLKSNDINLSSEERKKLKNAISIINETRRQTYETLKPGGAELDLSHDRKMEELVYVYEQRITSGILKGWNIKPTIHISEIQKIIPSELQQIYSVYPRIYPVNLKDIKDENLRKSIAFEIFVTELSAIFEFGAYDSDTHLGNWLIDLINKNIWRIDYSQFITISKSLKKDFNKVFFELLEVNPVLDKSFTNALLNLIEIPEGKYTLNSKDLSVISQKLKFTADRNDIQDRLFDLRELLNQIISDKYKIDLEIQYKREFRSGFSAMAKLSKLKELIGEETFAIELYKRCNKISKNKVKLTLLDLAINAKGLINFQKAAPVRLDVVAKEQIKIPGDAKDKNYSNKLLEFTTVNTPTNDLLTDDVELAGHSDFDLLNSKAKSERSGNESNKIDLTRIEKMYPDRKVIPVPYDYIKKLIMTLFY
jgi:hypothetical protein